MGVLVDGVWYEDDSALQSSDGTCANPATSFRERMSVEGRFKPEAGRYHLYVALGCPFAQRTLILRSVKKLQDKISVSIAHPVNTEKGWKFEEFEGSTLDHVYGCQYIPELYLKADSHFTGKASVPILWDKQTHTIVNNESSDIAEMLNEFPGDEETPDFYPVELREEIDKMVNMLKEDVIMQVYKVGFAGNQEKYEYEVNNLFSSLDWLEEHLEKSRYLVGDRITLADWLLFPTVFRFDYAMYSMFKCNIKRMVDYPNIFGWARELYQYPGVEETCNIKHIFMTYWSMKKFNPSGIYPAGPVIEWNEPHNRDRDYA